MTERPILMQPDMVRATLAGLKMETRRVIKSPGNLMHIDRLLGDWSLSGKPELFKKGSRPWRPAKKPKEGEWIWSLQSDVDDTGCDVFTCPYGQPGDQLWVRESFDLNSYNLRYSRVSGVYPANYGSFVVTLTEKERDKYSKWKRKTGGKPGMFMFRSLSRIQLLVKDVRVERLQDITERGAVNEGCTFELGKEIRTTFQTLWDSINKKRGYGWDVNPWVWVVKFERIKP